MSLYVISIGGTGHRVAEALLHLAGTGAVPTDKIKLLCVDSDVSNGNLDSLIGQIKLYQATSQQGVVLNTQVEPAYIGHADKANPCWSPTLADDSMESLFNKQAMDPMGKMVFDSLFTPEEQTVKLNEGFYGHTSIGALLIAEQIRPDGVNLCRVWDDFFNGINHNEDKILLIGSTFGGTGASGIPVISTILRQTFPGGKIGALLVMPYFKFIKDDNNPLNEISIDWTYFIPKTKAAFSYYEKQNFNQIFNDLYIIGEAPGNFMDVVYSKGANSQANKPHIIELYAASAAIDYIKTPSDGYNIKVMSRDVDKHEDGYEQHLSTMKMLLDPNSDPTIPNKIAQFMRFCVMYTKYYYHCLKRGRQNGAWYAYYKEINENYLDTLYEYCKSYMRWIRKAHLKNAADGSVSTIYEQSVRFVNFSDQYLFDYQPENGGLFGNNIILNKINPIDSIIAYKTAPNAEEIDSRFSSLSVDTSLTDMANLVENLKAACTL